MPAPKRPNTARATAATIRKGQETMAAKLREAGWVCIPPEQAILRDPSGPAHGMSLLGEDR